MLSILLCRIKKTWKQKPSKAVTGGNPVERTGARITAETEISDIPDTVSAGGELPVSLKIIRGNKRGT